MILGDCQLFFSWHRGEVGSLLSLRNSFQRAQDCSVPSRLGSWHLVHWHCACWRIYSALFSSGWITMLLSLRYETMVAVFIRTGSCTVRSKTRASSGPFSVVSKPLARAVRQGKEMKGMQLGEEEV